MNNTTPVFNGTQDQKIKKVIVVIEQLWDNIKTIQKDVSDIKTTLNNKFSQPWFALNKYWRFKIGDTNTKLHLQQSSDNVTWIDVSIHDALS